MKKRDHERRPNGGESAGQAGDDEGLQDRAEADSQSVRELIDEGQAREAEVIAGVEDAADHPQRPVRTREVPENDVPEEYREGDQG